MSQEAQPQRSDWSTQPTNTHLVSVCPECGNSVDMLRGRIACIIGLQVKVFCSEDCRQQALRPKTREPTLELPELRQTRGQWPWLIAVASVAIVVVPIGVRIHWTRADATASVVKAVPKRVPPPEPDPSTIPYGPELPPPEFFREGDVWFHPLPGPVRRLPERDSRRFGVERPHDSPESCRQGHCGCDLGQLRGEPVLAVHDGVVERVVRDSNDRSGRYVRLLHRGGTIVTQYMHLDEITEKLVPGVHVRAGDKIGTVGESGVDHSGPHLHFTVATRTDENSADVYIDPEPLLTLWPLLHQ